MIVTGIVTNRGFSCLSSWEGPFIEMETIMRAAEFSSSDVDLVVVGGGLAGLSTAALVAQAGRSVIVLEQAAEVGGRATTQVRDGVFFNLGPHALYFLGHAFPADARARRASDGRIPESRAEPLVARESGRGPPAPRPGFSGAIKTVQHSRERAADSIPGDASQARHPSV